MQLDERLRQVADQVPAPPEGDAPTIFHRGVRRRRRRRAMQATLAVVLVGVLGVGVVSLLGRPARLDIANEPAPPGQCVQARETFTEARETRSLTFGSSQDSRDALRTMRDTVERHPECFDADTVEQVPERAEGLLPPTVAAEQALAEAEDACGPPPHSAHSGGPVQTPTADTPERAVTDARGQAGGVTVPPGEPLRTFEGDGLVGFSFRDGDGFNGWVLTVRTDSGWYVRHAIACEGGSPAPATLLPTESSTAG